jgi:PAS domain S-box-containing protein
MFVELDVHGKIVDLNDKLLEVSGFQSKELIGKSYLTLTDLPRQLFMSCSKNLVAGKTWNGMIRNVTRAGSHYWTDATIVPQKDCNGKITKILISGYPITSLLGAELFNEQAQKFGWPVPMVASKSARQKNSVNGDHGRLPLSSKAG